MKQLTTLKCPHTCVLCIIVCVREREREKKMWHSWCNCQTQTTVMIYLNGIERHVQCCVCPTESLNKSTKWDITSFAITDLLLTECIFLIVFILSSLSFVVIIHFHRTYHSLRILKCAIHVCHFAVRFDELLFFFFCCCW